MPRWSLRARQGPSASIDSEPLAHTFAFGAAFVALLSLSVLATVLPTGKNAAYGPYADGSGSVFYDPGPSVASVDYVDERGETVSMQQTVAVPLLDNSSQPLYIPLQYPNGSTVIVSGVQQNQSDGQGGMLPVMVQRLVMQAGKPTLRPQYAGYGPSYQGVSVGDTAWMLAASALVLIMTPGIAFFYGGMVRPKNVVSTIFQSFMCISLISLLWIFIGFSLAFGPDWGGLGILGNPSAYFFYNGVGSLPLPYTLNANMALPYTVPWSIYSAFQMMFAIVSSAIITGSFVERVRMGAACLFTILWHLVVYCPTAHVMWSPKGLLRWWGVLDFAGGSVVHISSGFAALVAAWYVGEADMSVSEARKPSSVPHVMLGTALMWFGWFGFNAGAAGAADALACQAWLNTNAAAASAMAAWVLLDCVYDKGARGLSACVGAVVGLVVITPGAGYVTIGAALTEGVVGATVCYHVEAFLMPYTHSDATLCFTANGVGGLVGFLLTACFACPQVNPMYDNGGQLMKGLFYGGVGANCLMLKHLAAVAGMLPFFVLASYLCLKVVDLLYPLRISPQEALSGLDDSKAGDRPSEICQAFASVLSSPPHTSSNSSSVIMQLLGDRGSPPSPLAPCKIAGSEQQSMQPRRLNTYRSADSPLARQHRGSTLSNQYHNPNYSAAAGSVTGSTLGSSASNSEGLPLPPGGQHVRRVAMPAGLPECPPYRLTPLELATRATVNGERVTAATTMAAAECREVLMSNKPVAVSSTLQHPGLGSGDRALDVPLRLREYSVSQKPPRTLG